MAGGRVGAGDDENSITDVTASDTRKEGRSQSLVILIIINLLTNNRSWRWDLSEVLQQK